MMTRTILMIMLLVLAGLIFFQGCASSGERAGAPGAVEKSGAGAQAAVSQSSAVVLRQAKPEEYGKDAVCPVLGDAFKVSQVTEAAEYKGAVHYFCCAGCGPKFKADPEKYLAR